MESKASIKNIRISPRKVRLVVNLIRGKKTSEALTMLKYSPKRSANVISKLINSAIGNAVNNNQMNADMLFIKTIFVDEGPTLKRIRPRAKGRAFQILKRSSRINIIVSDDKGSK